MPTIRQSEGTTPALQGASRAQASQKSRRSNSAQGKRSTMMQYVTYGLGFLSVAQGRSLLQNGTIPTFVTQTSPGLPPPPSLSPPPPVALPSPPPPVVVSQPPPSQPPPAMSPPVFVAPPPNTGLLPPPNVTPPAMVPPANVPQPFAAPPVATTSPTVPPVAAPPFPFAAPPVAGGAGSPVVAQGPLPLIGRSSAQPNLITLQAGIPYIFFNANDAKCITDHSGGQPGYLITIEDCWPLTDPRAETQQFYLALTSGTDIDPIYYTWKVLTPSLKCLQQGGVGVEGPMIVGDTCGGDPAQTMEFGQLYDSTVLFGPTQFGPTGGVVFTEAVGPTFTLAPPTKLNNGLNWDYHQLWNMYPVPNIFEGDGPESAQEYQLRAYRGFTPSCLTIDATGTVGSTMQSVSMQPCEAAMNQLWTTEGLGNGDVTHRIKSLMIGNDGLPGVLCLDYNPIASSAPRAFGCGPARTDVASQEVDIFVTTFEDNTVLLRFGFTERCLENDPDSGLIMSPCDGANEYQYWAVESLS